MYRGPFEGAAGRFKGSQEHLAVFEIAAFDEVVDQAPLPANIDETVFLVIISEQGDSVARHPV